MKNQIYQSLFFIFILLLSFSCKKEEDNDKTKSKAPVSAKLLQKEYWDGSLYKEYFYDADNKLIKINNHNPNNETFVNYVVYEYNQDGKIIKANTFSYSAAASQFIFNRYLTNEYENNKRVTSKQFFVDTLGNEGLATVFNYEYNEDGTLKSMITQMRNTDRIMQPTLMTTYEYNSNRNYTTTKSYSIDQVGTNWVHNGTNLFGYDGFVNPFYELFGAFDIPLENYTPNNIINVTTTKISHANPDKTSAYNISYNENKYPLEILRINKNQAYEKREFVYVPKK